MSLFLGTGYNFRGRNSTFSRNFSTRQELYWLTVEVHVKRKDFTILSELNILFF